MQYDLSIIIPVYNAENTLVRCLNSILIQKSNYRIQIIFIDDGSTDNSLEILNNFQKKYSNVIVYSQKNEKQAQARNKGLSYAHGKYITFFDADDEIKSGMLRELLGLMKQGADMAMCGIEKKYTHSIVVENQTRLVDNNTRKNLLLNFLVCNRELDVGLWNKIFRRELIEKAHLKFSNGNFFEDSLFVFQYLLLINPQQIRFVPKSFYRLFKHSNSTTTVFHPEIDNLADRYINQVIATLKIESIDLSQDQIDAFKARIYLHVVHHHIHYDPTWNFNTEKQFLYKKVPRERAIFKMIKCLPLQYTLAILMAIIFPRLYIKLYQRRG